MSDALLDKVRERAALAVADRPHTVDALCGAVDAILADVETALVLARREGYVNARRETEPERDWPIAVAREVYPLPTRTRQVPREEPVPGSEHPLYRVIDGYPQRHDGLEWRHVLDIPASALSTMRHLLDLHDNPTRTETVPGDESDPWGKG